MIASQIRPCAVLSTSGQSPESGVIKVVTCSKYTHIATVAWVSQGDLEKYFPEKNWAGWKPRNMVFESTTLDSVPCEILGEKIQGLQAHSVDAWVQAYNGRVWCQNLIRPVTGAESQRMADAALTLLKMRRPYDGGGALIAGTRLLKWLPCVGSKINDRKRVYCAEVTEQTLMIALYSRDLPGFDPGRDRPRDTVRLADRKSVV